MMFLSFFCWSAEISKMCWVTSNHVWPTFPCRFFPFLFLALYSFHWIFMEYEDGTIAARSSTSFKAGNAQKFTADLVIIHIEWPKKDVQSNKSTFWTMISHIIMTTSWFSTVNQIFIGILKEPLCLELTSTPTPPRWSQISRWSSSSLPRTWWKNRRGTAPWRTMRCWPAWIGMGKFFPIYSWIYKWDPWRMERK